MRQGLLDNGASDSKVQYLLGRVHVDVTGKQESVTNYPVRTVIMHVYYLTKEGNNIASGAPEG